MSLGSLHLVDNKHGLQLLGADLPIGLIADLVEQAHPVLGRLRAHALRDGRVQFMVLAVHGQG